MPREMKDSGIEWIGEIPADWQVAKLKHSIKWKSVKGNPDGTVLSLYRDYGVIPKDSRDDNHNITSLDTSTYKVVDVGDLVINKMKAWQGSMAVSEYSGIVSPAYHVCEITNPDIYKKYFHLLLRNPSYIPEYTRLSTGMRIGQWDLGVDDFKNIPFLIPPYDEQKKIAEHLTKVCTDIDSVIEKTKATIEEYKKLKQSLIAKAVTKGIRKSRDMIETEYEWIGAIPSTWKAIKSKWLLVERKERSEFGEEEPLSMSQKFGLIPTKEMDMIPNMASSFVGAKLVYVGDLVFNKLKAHLGIFAVSTHDGLVSPDYAVYYPTGLANVKYLEYLFKTPQYIAEFRKKSSGVGAGLTRLYTGDLFSIYCSLPPMEEQEEIVTYIDKRCSEIDTLVTKKEQIVVELEAYKKSLIYEVVTGKREV